MTGDLRAYKNPYVLPIAVASTLGLVSLALYGLGFGPYLLDLEDQLVRQLSSFIKSPLHQNTAALKFAAELPLDPSAQHNRTGDGSVTGDANDTASNGGIVVTALNPKESVNLVHSNGHTQPVRHRQSLRTSQLIELGAYSFLDLEFQSGYRLQIEGPGTVSVDLPSVGDVKPSAGPIIITLNKAILHVSKVGSAGSVLVLWPRGLVLPEAVAPVSVANFEQEHSWLEFAPLVITQHDSTVKTLTTESLSATTSPLVGLQHPAPAEPRPADSYSDRPRPADSYSHRPRPADSYSNRPRPADHELDQYLAALSPRLQKCQANSLRQGLPARGSLWLSITWEPTGEASKVEITRSTLKTSELESCAVQVIRDHKIPEFTGTAITRSFPLRFD